MSEGAAPPLKGVRVIDQTDAYGAYAGRLLAGLGAEVIRITAESEEASTTPLSAVSDELDTFQEFIDAGKKSLYLDSNYKDSEALEKLVESADVVLGSEEGPAPGYWLESNPEIVHVVMSPFGWGLAPSWGPVDDLIVLGQGGLLQLGGYLDAGPVGAYGNQSQIASGIFGAIAALVGLIERRSSGKGNHADVSAQEAMAQALEDSLPTYALTGKLKSLRGESAREAGTGIYACADGYVSMVAGRLGTAKAWASLVEWLVAEFPEAAELRDERWADFSYRQSDEANERFTEIFERFAADRTKAELYAEAQSRGIALSPVSNIRDLLENEQLAARGFFHRFYHERLETEVTVPGPPFRLSRSSQPPLEEAPETGSDTEAILMDLGVELEASDIAGTG